MLRSLVYQFFLVYFRPLNIEKLKEKMDFYKHQFDKMSKQYYYNVAIVGDGGVGKTAFVRGAMGMAFPRQYHPTTGVKFHQIQSPEETIINFWDYAGQEKYNLINPNINMDLAVIMYSADNRVSYRHANTFWKDFVEETFDCEVLFAESKRDCQDLMVNNPNSIQFHNKNHNAVNILLSAIDNELNA